MEPMDLPYGKPSDWLIAFVDVETTGLTPGYHEMVDAGIVMADLEGNEVDSFFERIMPEHPERASDDALSCNGFSIKRWEKNGAVSKGEAVEKIIQFYMNAAGDGTQIDKNVIFCAYNESFDHPFLDHLFRSADQPIRQLHHYTMDLPSIAWGMGITNLHCNKVADRLNVKDEPKVSKGDDPWEHTGLTGAKLNKRIYLALCG